MELVSSARQGGFLISGLPGQPKAKSFLAEKQTRVKTFLGEEHQPEWLFPESVVSHHHL